MADPQLIEDPFRGFSFIAEFGFVRAGFSDVGGLVQEVDVEEVEECTNPFFMTSFPKRFKFSRIVLARGKTSNRDLVNWFHTANGVRRSSSFKRDGQLHVLDPRKTSGVGKDSILATWNVHQAWPTKLSITDWTAKETNLVIETLELDHEGIKEVTPGAGFDLDKGQSLLLVPDRPR